MKLVKPLWNFFNSIEMMKVKKVPLPSFHALNNEEVPTYFWKKD